MEIIRFLAGMYISGFLLLIGIGMFSNIRINRGYRYLVVLFACSVGVFAFAFEPGTGLDLYRLQRYTTELVFNGNGIIKEIIGAEGYLGGMSLTGMISFNLLCYVVRLLGDIHWLSTISVLLTLGIIGSIIVDYVISEGYSSKALGWSLLLSFMGIQMQYVFSGVRNAVAVAYVALALYLWLYKKRKLIPVIILFLLAVTMHPAVLIILLPIMLCRRKGQRIWRLAALLIMPIIFLLPNVLRLIPVNFSQYLAGRISFYENVVFQYDRPEMIANGLVFIVIGLTLGYYTQHSLIIVNDGIEQWYVNAYYILGFAMLGCTIHRDFALRIGYIMWIGAMPIVLKLLFRAERYDKPARIIHMLLRLSMIVCFLKVYYDTILAFSHWNFG